LDVFDLPSRMRRCFQCQQTLESAALPVAALDPCRDEDAEAMGIDMQRIAQGIRRRDELRRRVAIGQTGERPHAGVAGALRAVQLAAVDDPLAPYRRVIAEPAG